MAETENSRKMPIFWIALIIIMFLIVVMCGGLIFVWGFTKSLLLFFALVWFFAIIAVIIFAVMWLFKKHRTDMIHIMKQRITKSCTLNKPDYIQELWIWGNPDDQIPARRIGFVSGFCKIKTKPKYEMVESIQESSGRKIMTKIKERDSESLYFISFNHGKGFPMNLFEQDELFLGLRNDISSFDGARMILKGVLSPEVFGCVTLAKHWDSNHIIDEPIKDTIFRYSMQDFLSELKNITDDALGISPEHQKRLEKSNMESISPVKDNDRK